MGPVDPVLFQVAQRAHAEARPGRELLLGQAGRQAVTPQSPPERLAQPVPPRWTIDRRLSNLPVAVQGQWPPAAPMSRAPDVLAA